MRNLTLGISMNITAYKKVPPSPIQFFNKQTGENTPDFKLGVTSCKTCNSTILSYYAYLTDAKCDCCGQWQNEEPIQM